VKLMLRERAVAHVLQYLLPKAIIGEGKSYAPCQEREVLLLSYRDRSGRRS
jgi:hypothetical protein